jgi:hypothetical protein
VERLSLHTYYGGILKFEVGNTFGSLTKGTRTPEHTAKVVASIRRTHKSKGYHVLDNIDLERMTAHCSVCGMVPVLKQRAGQRNEQIICWVKGVARNHYIQAKVAYPGQALEMLQAQNNKCAICDGTMLKGSVSSDGIVLDHDHVTGFIRGYVHQRCNKGIGNFNDNASALRQAAEYLERLRPHGIA